MKQGSATRWIAVVAGYACASVLLTWPLVTHLSTTLFGDYGDTRGVAWWIWAKSHGAFDGPVDSLVAAPFGLANQDIIRQPLFEWLVLAIARLSNEVLALNLFVLAALPLTALTTYGALERLGMDRKAAFVAGLMFGFCPAAVMQAAGGHAPFALNAFIPLFVLALFNNRSQRSIASALLVAASFAAIAFTALYFAYFALFIALFFVGLDVLELLGQRPAATIVWRNYAWCAAFGAAIVMPVELPAIVEQLSTPADVVAKAGHVRDYAELFFFSSRPWDFLIPPIDHPLLGRYFAAFARGHLHGSNLFEQTLYLGIFPVLVVSAGALAALLRGFEGRARRFFVFFFFGALWMYFLSLPPKIAGGVPTAGGLLYHLAPMFRVYARFGILVNFFVACAMAAFLTEVRQRMRPRAYDVILGVLTVVVAFEYWTVPPGYALRVDSPPEVYRWLSRQPGDFIIAEYPMVAFDEAASYSYPFWQRVHGKRLANGAEPNNARAWAFFKSVQDISQPQVPSLLAAAGVRYVILHRAMYREGPIPSPLKRYYEPSVAESTFNGGAVPVVPASLKLVASFGPDLVYSVGGSR